ncbi:sulfotransferase domain-containing protein [Laspinema olomoucense]|uniref:Sulfotransferase domain-containing protein n=1 Tax=Laspinema olomoucense D3b TaxID=2953688 RepID=A0ABT2NB84_9CYAN|nr:MULTISPECIES: sulfotransferase domain-containing protein [unclassified Laspinema]MCT7979954.1 sulfotransferase domain-containing protein [Laspinema sp. D3b]MCT7994863.1 sulfotransferase domain-containing protein [Laspinema sp. D3c]
MPDFLIIGTQKGGTTSLYHYLTQHTQILPAAQKEVHFFGLNFHHGIDWYRQQFPLPESEKQMLTGEATPYYLFHPLVPRRVKNLFPQVKLIVLLRNPVERAWSHYNHEVRLGFETLSFAEAIAQEPARLAGEVEKMLADPKYYSYNHQHYTYLSRGIYANQLKSWMELFPKEQFLILSSEAFYANPAATLAKTLAFLGLPPMEIEDYPKHNAGEYATLPDGLQSTLNQYFQPHNQHLLDEFSLNFSWD